MSGQMHVHFFCRFVGSVQSQKVKGRNMLSQKVYELSSTLTGPDCLQRDSEGFILLAESNQILLKIDLILILLIFMYVST